MVWTQHLFAHYSEYAAHHYQDPNRHFQQSHFSKEITPTTNKAQRLGQPTQQKQQQLAAIASGGADGGGGADDGATTKTLNNGMPVQQIGQAELIPTSSRPTQFDKLPDPTKWPVPGKLDANGFNPKEFEDRLSSWRDYKSNRAQAEFQQQQSNDNATFQVIPYTHRTPIFQRRPVAWNLMVMVMADIDTESSSTSEECASQLMTNATNRLITTIGDVLNTQRAQVVAYLPNNNIIAGQQETSSCRSHLYQSIRENFAKAMSIGQLHVISSPPRDTKPEQNQYRADAYRFARNGLDFAFATEFCHVYSDLCLFLQAGSRIRPEWWMQYPQQGGEVGKPDSKQQQPEILTTNRDYGKEIMLAYEARLRLSEDGISHELCYMNFAVNVGVGKDQYGAFENPTGALFERSQLMRLSMMLRSFLPYGKLTVSQLLERYCSGLKWQSDRPGAPLLLFQYESKGNETHLERLADAQPIENTTTYPYMILNPVEDPAWVKVNSNMVGPQPITEMNNYMQPVSGDPDENAEEEDTDDERYWLTFVVPTAWRHTTKNDIKGNAYVVECLRQLSAAIKEHFTGEHKAMILVLVSGVNQADINRHQKGLEAEFPEEINSGKIKLVQAPIHQYPTSHGLAAHYKDPEQRVRWRSKQNLDISAALFAAKGNGKYIMMIEDDSGFRPATFKKGIKHILTNLHHSVNPNDSVVLDPNIIVNSPAGEVEDSDLSNGRISINYGKEKDEPALIEMGHRETWSQIRFSFGYSGVMIHDEDAFVYGMMHSVLYQEKPCDLLFEIADSIRNGVTRDHFLRWNLKSRHIMHRGQISSLEGKVYSDLEISKG